MKKRYAVLLIALAFTFALAAGCSSSSADHSSNSTRQSVQKEDERDPVSGISSNSETTGTVNEGKNAVVYFSATGSTAEVAQLIADETGADIFEIVPDEIYTAEDLNYSDDNCRANQEMKDDSARPAIETDLSAVSEYDRIYLGYPVWWGTAPRIIQTFLESYDVPQAAVYTFCTSGGSGVEQSVKDLQNLYPNVDIIDGKRFSSASADDVKDWIESLN